MDRLLAQCGSVLMFVALGCGGSVDTSNGASPTVNPSVSALADAAADSLPAEAAAADSAADSLPAEAAAADSAADAGLPRVEGERCVDTLPADAGTYDEAVTAALLCNEHVRSARRWGTCDGQPVVIDLEFWGAAVKVFAGTGASPMVGMYAINEGPHYCYGAIAYIAGEVPAVCIVTMHGVSVYGADNIQILGERTCPDLDAATDADAPLD
jgi:hypothetical protein